MAGTGFQISFKVHCPLLFLESCIELQFPWFEFGSMRTKAGVMILDALLEIFAESNILLRRDFALNYIDIIH